jgi:hypothetical protein
VVSVLCSLLVRLEMPRFVATDVHNVPKICENPYIYCSVCEAFTAQAASLTLIVTKAWELKVGTKQALKPSCYGACASKLRKWLQGLRSPIRFAVLMV